MDVYKALIETTNCRTTERNFTRGGICCDTLHKINSIFVQIFLFSFCGHRIGERVDENEILTCTNVVAVESEFMNLIKSSRSHCFRLYRGFYFMHENALEVLPPVPCETARKMTVKKS